MGADNWGICPKCKKSAEADKAKERDRVGKAYGKVPAEKYQEMFAEAARPVELNSTLREDYEIRTNEGGEFSVSYGAHCSSCGFSFQFKHEVPNVLDAKR